MSASTVRRLIELTPPPLPAAKLPPLGTPPPWRVIMAVLAIIGGVIILDVLMWRTSTRREVVQQRATLARIAATMAVPAFGRDEGDTGLENRYQWALAQVAAERRVKAKKLEEDLATFGDRIWGDLDGSAYDRSLRAMAHRRMQTAVEEALSAARATNASPLRQRAALMLAGQLLAGDFSMERGGETPEKLFRAALATCDREIEPLAWAEAQGYLAEALRLRGESAEARRLAEEALAVRQKQVGEKDPSLQRWLLGRAMASADSVDRYEWFLRVIPLQNVGGVLSQREVQRVTQDCGRALVYAGQFDKSEVFLREAVRQGEMAGPAGALDLAKALSDLGHACARMQRRAEAEPLLRRGLDLTVATVGSQHDEMLHPLLALGMLKMDEQDWPAAERYSLQALDLAQRSKAPDRGRFFSNACAILAEVMRMSDRPQQAETMYRRELAAVEAHFGPEDLAAANTLNKLAVLLRTQNRWTEAERLLRRVVAIEEKHLPPADPRRMFSLGNLGHVVACAGRPQEGEEMVRRAVAFFDAQAEPDYVALAINVQYLATILLIEGRKDEAWNLFLRALATIARAQAKQAEPLPQVRVIVDGAAFALADKGIDRTEAQARVESLFQRALKGWQDADKK